MKFWGVAFESYFYRATPFPGHADLRIVVMSDDEDIVLLLLLFQKELLLAIMRNSSAIPWTLWTNTPK
ncbi:hypothetical protein PS6_004385 [Mucor atramentarius]